MLSNCRLVLLSAMLSKFGPACASFLRNHKFLVILNKVQLGRPTATKPHEAIKLTENLHSDPPFMLGRSTSWTTVSTLLVLTVLWAGRCPRSSSARWVARAMGPGRVPHSFARIFRQYTRCSTTGCNHRQASAFAPRHLQTSPDMAHDGINCIRCRPGREGLPLERFVKKREEAASCCAAGLLLAMA